MAWCESASIRSISQRAHDAVSHPSVLTAARPSARALSRSARRVEGVEKKRGDGEKRHPIRPGTNDNLDQSPHKRHRSQNKERHSTGEGEEAQHLTCSATELHEASAGAEAREPRRPPRAQRDRRSGTRGGSARSLCRRPGQSPRAPGTRRSSRSVLARGSERSASGIPQPGSR